MVIDFCDLVDWYEEQCRIAITNGNLPKDVTVEEASEYMEFVYCTSKQLNRKEVK